MNKEQYESDLKYQQEILDDLNKEKDDFLKGINEKIRVSQSLIKEARIALDKIEGASILESITYEKDVLTIGRDIFTVKPTRLEKITLTDHKEWSNGLHLHRWDVHIQYKPTSTTRVEYIRIHFWDEEYAYKTKDKLAKLILGK